MNILQALVLGAFQGVAEFLPISSSGHLALLKTVMQLQEVPQLFDIILHVATLLSILVVFRKRVGGIIVSIFRWVTRNSGDPDRENLAIVLPALLATVLTAGIGLAIQKLDLPASPLLVGICFLVTAGLLVSTSFARGKLEYRQFGWKQGLITGIAQGIGVLPGISRSGITISAGLASGMSRSTAGEFSFLLAIPAIAGALLLELGDLGELAGTVSLPALVLGALAAFLVGILALLILMPIVRKGKLAWFALYLVPAGLISIFLL